MNNYRNKTIIMLIPFCISILLFTSYLFSSDLSDSQLRNWLIYIGQLEKQVKNHPQNAELLMRLTHAYVKIGDSYRANEAFNNLKVLGIDPVRINILKGDLNYELKQWNEATSIYLNVLSISPYNYYVLSQLWKIVFQSKLSKVAVSFDVQTVIDLLDRRGMYFPLNYLPEKADVNEAQLESDKAMSLMSTGRYDEAVLHFIKALNNEPSNPEYFRGLGTSYKNINDDNKAIGAYTIYLLLNPDAPDKMEVNLYILNQLKQKAMN